MNSKNTNKSRNVGCLSKHVIRRTQEQWSEIAGNIANIQIILPMTALFKKCGWNSNYINVPKGILRIPDNVCHKIGKYNTLIDIAYQTTASVINYFKQKFILW